MRLIFVHPVVALCPPLLNSLLHQLPRLLLRGGQPPSLREGDQQSVHQANVIVLPQAVLKLRE